MSMFDDIKLEWQGGTYVIPARMALEAIARIEEVMTIDQVVTYVANCNAPTGRLSKAYAALLRAAGAGVTDEEVYAELFGQGADTLVRTRRVLLVFQAIMIPPEVQKIYVRQQQAARVQAVGEKPAAGNLAAAPMKASSKPGSSLWSEAAGSHRKASGPGRRSKSSGSSKRKRRSR
jgi:hypothetical protein